MTTQQKFNDWLDNIVKTEKPDAGIIAYWFGIFESDEGFQTYLVGSNEYDEDDDDWACNTDFEPKNKYLILGDAEEDWEKILENIKQYLKEYTQTTNFKNSFLNNAQAIATGFDGGDLYNVR